MLIEMEILPDGSTGRGPHIKYHVTIKTDNGPDEQATFEKDSMSRDRRNFSKVLLRDFLKTSLTKEAWHGAPWIVKDHLAKDFDLPTEVPPHLQQSAVREKKALAQQKRAHMEYQRQQAEQSMLTITDFRQYPYSRKHGNSLMPSGPPTANQPWQSKPGKKNRFLPHNFQYAPGSGEMIFYNPDDPNQGPYSPNGTPMGFMFYPDGPEDGLEGFNGQIPMAFRDRYPFPFPIKYPIEDLELPPKGPELQRPGLKFFTDLACAGAESDGETGAGKYTSESIGPLLEIWNTLNVHNEVYILDSFTLDDFAQALRFSSRDIDCELLSEVHCAVLKQFVDENGKLLVDMPKLEDASDDESSEDEESEEDDEDAEPEPEPPRRATRSSLAKAEAAMVKAKSPTPDPFAHRAVEFHSIFPWQEHCKDRNFTNQRWQPILAGLLYQLSLSDNFKERCDKLLCKLLPPELEASVETVVDEYVHLDVADRLDALQLIVMLSLRTKAIRDHLERMTAEMTELRKKKIELQRQKKDM
jgi:DDT domain/WSTF, HB1, Itc1p, MBD9 motif 1